MPVNSYNSASKHFMAYSAFIFGPLLVLGTSPDEITQLRLVHFSRAQNKESFLKTLPQMLESAKASLAKGGKGEIRLLKSTTRISRACKGRKPLKRKKEEGKETINMTRFYD